jgi:hypothetical protein
MIGIRLSRPLASLVAGRFGWRGAYLLEALAVCAILAALCRILPSRKPRRAQPYRVLVGSLHNLLATEPVLRRQALYQALCMASFGIFWSGVALRLAAAPFALSQTGIGLFMLSGAGGVVHRANRRTARRPRLEPDCNRRCAWHGRRVLDETNFRVRIWRIFQLKKWHDLGLLISSCDWFHRCNGGMR